MLTCVLLLLVLQVRKMQEAGYVIGNLDCTIIAQKPKLSPHKVSRHGSCSSVQIGSTHG